MKPVEPIAKRLHELGALDAAAHLAVANSCALDRLLAGDRHRGPARARRLLWLELRRAWQFNDSAIARIFGVDHTTVRAGILKAEREERAAS